MVTRTPTVRAAATTALRLSGAGVTKARRPARQRGTCSRRGELGRGVAGVVYKTCCGGRCSYVTKVFSSARDFGRARNEIALQALVARAGFAPRVHSAACTAAECYLVMDRVQMTLGQYVAKRGGLKPREQAAVVKLLERVAELGVDHGDVHSGNISVDPPFKLRLLDFSEASRASKVAVGAQVGKLVGDLGVLFPRLRFEVLEAYSKRAHGAAKSPCAEEAAFLAMVAKQTGLDVRDPDVEDAVLDIWMDGPADCDALVRRVRRRFKL